MIEAKFNTAKTLLVFGGLWGSRAGMGDTFLSHLFCMPLLLNAQRYQHQQHFNLKQFDF